MLSDDLLLPTDWSVPEFEVVDIPLQRTGADSQSWKVLAPHLSFDFSDDLASNLQRSSKWSLRPSWCVCVDPKLFLFPSPLDDKTLDEMEDDLSVEEETKPPGRDDSPFSKGRRTKPQRSSRNRKPLRETAFLKTATEIARIVQRTDGCVEELRNVWAQEGWPTTEQLNKVARQHVYRGVSFDRSNWRRFCLGETNSLSNVRLLCAWFLIHKPGAFLGEKFGSHVPKIVRAIQGKRVLSLETTKE